MCMEREILFRAYCYIRCHTLVAREPYGTGSDWVPASVMCEVLTLNINKQSARVRWAKGETDDVKIGPDCILMEYTSYKDSKDTKIFEGDLFPLSIGSYKTFAEVVFHNGMFCIRYKHPEISDPYTYVPLYEFLAAGNKIIAGNIHDNEELLQNI